MFNVPPPENFQHISTGLVYKRHHSLYLMDSDYMSFKVGSSHLNLSSIHHSYSCIQSGAILKWHKVGQKHSSGRGEYRIGNPVVIAAVYEACVGEALG